MLCLSFYASFVFACLNLNFITVSITVYNIAFVNSERNTSGNWKNEKLCGNTTPAGRSVFTQFRVFPVFTSVDITVYQYGKNVLYFFYNIAQGILRNPDRTRTRTWTRTRRKPGLGKNPGSCSDSRLRNPDSTIENPDSKSKILDSMKLDSDNIRNPEYIPIFNCLSETYNRNSQILR